ncbi:hypothetical protein [Nitrospirillum viridazoti]|uniref:hypothetical protein n=1 Tax=Nitrospirillum viridazoti TaxID=3144925 RepID=UPI0011A5156A|nr:hypothetical protein [Nitrospirillum amazonense]
MPSFPLVLVLYRHLRIIGTPMKFHPQKVKHATFHRYGGVWLATFGDGAVRLLINSTWPPRSC